ncbi:MAG: hypothetical protein ABIN25_02755 [Ginsengibacter sp.]
MTTLDYQEEIQRLKRRFAIIYAGSLILIALFIGAFWLYHSSTGEIASGDSPRDNNEKTALLNIDETLHESLARLDGLNISYAKVLAESADSTSLDSLNNLITIAQTEFSELIDRMYSRRGNFQSPENTNKSDSIIYTFISALNSQKANNALRMAFSGNEINLERDSFTIFQSQIDVQTKSDSIANLHDQLRSQNQFNRNSFTAVVPYENNTEILTLQANIKKQTDSLENLLALYKTVVKDNRALEAQLKLKSTPPSSDANQTPDKIKSLNNKIDDLYAELSLSTVDCNLTRANAKDIIYNSRQRRDLLEASLASLKNLSGSDNPVIQRKVKEKMQLLQNIASTVRD